MSKWIAKFHLITFAVLVGGGLAMILGGLIKFLGYTTVFGADPVILLAFLVLFPLELIMAKWLIFDDPLAVEF